MTKLIAHRGYSEKYPENTLTAFRAAKDLKADGIELDVHLTKDGKLVVHHDYYLGNPDNGEGLIFKKDLAYIQVLKIGEDEEIPTLEEVFDLIGDSLHYELELKGFTEAFLLKVVTLVKSRGLVSNIEFTSPNAYNLSRLKELEPTFTTGIFLSPYPGWMDAELGRTLAANNARLGGASVLHCPLEILDEEFITAAHAQNLKVHAADCNTEEELRKAFDLKVDQLSTNRLELALQTRG
ncbi:MAG TPA: glycerophosphodiester phosphodiesterase [Verrucomicrobiae bacterium]|nr:glycerophosphodiester phosphodiesterase [Verrucomicrobiae bacterium]